METIMASVASSTSRRALLGALTALPVAASLPAMAAPVDEWSRLRDVLTMLHPMGAGAVDRAIEAGMRQIDFSLLIHLAGDSRGPGLIFRNASHAFHFTGAAG
jgi:hypothetical protein